jgi:hypothetical protein
MKALSFSQPWCWAVVDELVRKHIENRTWAPPIDLIGHQFAIHAAKSWDNLRAYPLIKDGIEYPGLTPTQYLQALGFDPPMAYHCYASSAIVGVATLDRVVTETKTLTDEQKRWFFGPVGWVLTDVVKLPEPIRCGGKQGLWAVPAELEPLIHNQVALARARKAV